MDQLCCPVHNPGLAFKKGDTEDSTRDVRTSSGTFLARGEDEVVRTNLPLHPLQQ